MCKKINSGGNKSYFYFLLTNKPKQINRYNTDNQQGY